MAEISDIGEAYQRYIVMVRNRSERILGDRAQAHDVAQEAFVKLIEYRHKAGREDNTAALLYRTATNLALNRLRDERRRRELLEAQGPTPVNATDLSDRLALRKVLRLVGHEEAEIATYYYLDGMEQEEIATLLGLQRRTVGRRLDHFRARAQKLLGAGLAGGKNV